MVNLFYITGMSTKIPRIKVTCLKCFSPFETTQWRINVGRGKYCSVSCSVKVQSTIHGHTKNGSTSRTYNTWGNMLRRCHHSGHHKYSKYGQVGIVVCERWHSFQNFLHDMGERPEGKTIDRWPNQFGSYEPGNCRWATPREQSENICTNVKITINGTLFPSISSLSRHTGIKSATLRYRIKCGWPEAAIISKPDIGDRSRS